jgi:hypothetical protein
MGEIGQKNGELLVKIEEVLTKVPTFTVLALAAMPVVVIFLSTIHLGVIVWQQVMAPPRFLIAVQGLLQIFGYFLRVLIGVELIER